MNIIIPIYVEEQPRQATGMTHAHPVMLRPLFFAGPREQDESLQRATGRLARELRRELTRLARAARHEEFAAFCFYPSLDEHILKLSLHIGSRNFQVRYLFVTIAAFDRRFAWTPSVPEVWFEVARGETLEERAQETLTEHFKLIERRGGGGEARPDATSIGGKAWLTSIEISLDVPAIYTPPTENLFALLGGGETLDGASELERVGRSLNALYPEQLDRAIGRENEAAEITRLLGAGDKRPVLLVGKRLVGKTTILHEFVRRRMDRRRESEHTLHAGARGSIADLAGDVWLIAPQRLISGMSYVGQWEGRLLAILEEVKRKRHTLYFDDLIGLFAAGQSSNSRLSVAQVLKPYVERRDVRVVAEATPEAFRVLQELDRSFADLFQVIQIREPSEEENLRTLLGYRRQLEQRYRCQFQVEALPTVIDLTRRYVSDAAFPGKAAALLRTLATKREGQEVKREDALTEFSTVSGLSVRFLDDRATINHAEVIEALGREVVGQRAAVAACADVVTVAKARLNDPSKPLASFLFLGPTGVGKTQCAKAFAKYLFGSGERITRFDMNEFASHYSVARLIGTFDAPDGLLTSAVRREPFAVVLFDEIEKAHPAVFDLLLGVMGDARLTDARGLTVDFTNTIIILTSNLGARAAASDLGFRQTNRSDASRYRQAAEKFFKPEFFNRLTRVVPFERLRREDVRLIARLLINNVFHREGLVRRGVKLIVEDDALDLLVEAGYHPQLGARALKRTLERQVTAPIAARLSAIAPDRPLLISLSASQGTINIQINQLEMIGEDAAPLMRLPLNDADDLLDRVADVLARVEEGAETLRPPGEIIFGENTAAHLQHYVIREQSRRVSRMLDRADERLARYEQNVTSGGARNARLIGRYAGRAAAPRSRSGKKDGQRHLARLVGPLVMAAANDLPSESPAALEHLSVGKNLYRFVHECAALRSETYGEQIADYVLDILRETALLEVLWTNLASAAEADESFAVNIPRAEWLITIASLDAAGRGNCTRLRDLYRNLFEKDFGCRVAVVRPGGESAIKPRTEPSSPRHVETLTLAGPLAGPLASVESGTHLFVSADESYAPVIVTARLSDEAVGRTDAPQDFSRLPPVLRIYAERAATLDLRSRLLATETLGNAELRAFMLSALSPPPELSV